MTPAEVSQYPFNWLVPFLAVLFALGLVAFILAAGAVAGALRNIKGLIGNHAEKREMGPQPFEVKPHIEFATTQELKRVEVKVDNVDTDLKAFRKEIVTNGESRRKSIEGKVESAREEARVHTEQVRLEIKGDFAKVLDQLQAISTEVARQGGAKP